MVPTRAATQKGEEDLLTRLLLHLEKTGASDLHLQQGAPPAFRFVGNLYQIEEVGELDQPTIEDFIRRLIDDSALKRLEERGAVDAGGQFANIRMRINVFRHRDGLAVSIRRIPMTPPDFQSLNLPSTVKRFASYPRGLVIICGPTGSGKSSTLAALINMINSTRRAHIITIEDPIEFVHKSNLSLVVQREVGKHTGSFSEALRDALRQDPNVLLVGEMRDLETIELALRAAETGHLVFSTLHTSGAAGSLARIVDVFEPAARDLIRTQLSLVLMGVMSQLLVPTVDGKSRVPVCEVLIVTDAVRHLIRENKFEQIPNIIQAGGDEGMLTFAAHITELARAGRIDYQAALEVAGEGWRIADMVFGD